MKRTTVKFCGLRSSSDVKKAISCDIDALGFICVPNRKRTVKETELKKMLQLVPRDFTTVGVFMNPTLETIDRWLSMFRFSAIQLHGEESPSFCRDLKGRFPKVQLIKVFHVDPKMEVGEIESYVEWIDVALFDSMFAGQKGGMGKRFDWFHIPSLAQKCRDAQIPFWVAGGVHPSNVGHLIETYHPDGVDVSSGIERNGVKDEGAMRALIEKVRQIDDVC